MSVTTDPSSAELFTHHSWKNDEKGIGCPLYTAFGFTHARELKAEFGRDAADGAMAVVNEYDDLAREFDDDEDKVIERSYAKKAWMKAIDAVEGIKDTSVALKAASALGWK